MDFLNDIKTETIIITNNEAKEYILNLHKLIPIKFMNITEFISKYLFSYDENTIIYLMHKYHYKYEVAKMYLDNIYFIKNKKYSHKKLNFLVSLKKELDKANLLYYNESFKEYIKHTEIIIYDLHLDRYYLDLFDGLKYQVVSRNFNNYPHEIYEFNNIDNEIRYVAKEIAKLIHKGISPNNIKLTNINEDYYNPLARIFDLYGLKLAIPYESSLASFPLVKEFIKLYQENSLTIEACFNKVDDKSRVAKELANVINSNIKYNNKDLLIYKINNTKLKSEKYTNEIDIIDYLNYHSNINEYIFMLSFNESIIPSNYMDTEYLTDNIKNEVGLYTSKELNIWQRTRIINSINDIKNLVITYKLKDNTHTYYPSNLCSNYQVIKQEITYNDSYSDTDDKIALVSAYDNYYKYGVKSDNFDILNNNYQIKYNSFNNKYTKINRVMDKLNLSYSKMQIYNKCAFKYYLTDILKIDTYQENFANIIGNLVHYVLEKALRNNDLNIDKYADDFLKDKEFNNKEMFFLNKYKLVIKDLLSEIIKEKEYQLFNDAMYEKRIEVSFNNNIYFNGIIDKILTYNDGHNTYLSLIDYKTGNDDISLKYFKYGIDIQLPIYLYLSTKLEFIKPRYCGFYLQKLNITDNDYRLIGYTNSSLETLKVVDSNYENSKIIKGLKTLKDGSFAKTSKILTDEEIDNLVKETEKMILKVIDNIENNEFPINPKISNGKLISCEYCQFKDICFVKKEDYQEIYPSIVGGDSDGLY